MSNSLCCSTNENNPHTFYHYNEHDADMMSLLDLEETPKQLGVNRKNTQPISNLSEKVIPLANLCCDAKPNHQQYNFDNTEEMNFLNPIVHPNQQFSPKKDRWVNNQSTHYVNPQNYKKAANTFLYRDAEKRNKLGKEQWISPSGMNPDQKERYNDLDSMGISILTDNANYKKIPYSQLNSKNPETYATPLRKPEESVSDMLSTLASRYSMLNENSNSKTKIEFTRDVMSDMNLSDATAKATATAQAIFCAGGSEGTARKAAKATAKAILFEKERVPFLNVWRRRTLKQQCNVVASIAILLALGSVGTKSTDSQTTPQTVEVSEDNEGFEMKTVCDASGSNMI